MCFFLIEMLNVCGLKVPISFNGFPPERGCKLFSASRFQLIGGAEDPRCSPSDVCNSKGHGTRLAPVFCFKSTHVEEGAVFLVPQGREMRTHGLKLGRRVENVRASGPVAFFLTWASWF